MSPLILRLMRPPGATAASARLAAEDAPRLLAQDVAESVGVEKRMQSRTIGRPSPQFIERRLKRHVADDAGEPPGQIGRLLVREQLRGDVSRRRAASGSRRARDSHRARRASRNDANSSAAVFLPMPGTPGMLSTASPVKREKIGDRFGRCAEARADLVVVIAGIGRCNPRYTSPSRISCDRSLSRVTTTLRKPAARARAASVPMMSSASYSALANSATPRCTAKFAAQRELALQIGRRRLAIGLVRGDKCRFGTKFRCAGSDRRRRRCARAGPLQEVGEEAGEAVKRMSRIAIAIHHVGRHGVVGPEDEVARIDVVNDARAGERIRVRRRAAHDDTVQCHAAESGCRSHRPALHAFVQRARARKMSDQIFHLIREHAPALEEDVFRIGRREWHRQQLHARLLRRARRLGVVAAAAGRYDVASRCPGHRG